MGDESLAFGKFRVLRTSRRVLEAGEPVRLGSRAFDILVALMDRAGQTVSNEELLAQIWPDLVVDEANLRVQVRALRRALADGHSGARYIVNVPMRGYCFVAPVERATDWESGGDGAGEKEDPANDLPLLVPRLVGRAETVAGLVRQVRRRRRLLTVVGPGGTGKSVVALAAAEQLRPTFKDGARFVDLAPISDPSHVPAAVASTLGISLAEPDQVAAFARALARRDLLVVIDNCEHVVGAVAELAEQLLRGTERVVLLVTSREPLRAPGEWVSRLQGLQVPPADVVIKSASEALTYSAIELFVERAAACAESFSLTDADAPLVSELCRRLDGIPLAIELAAAHVESLTLGELAARLDDRFRLLTKGKRTAPPRQQTLRGAMDWSYGTLSSAEQRVLRLLSVFPGHFDADGASYVAAAERGSAEGLSRVADLVEKSLVSAHFRGEQLSYQLLATTRAYAFEKLTESGEEEEARRRHAEYTRQVLNGVQSSSPNFDAVRWCAENGHIIDDVRAVVGWAFSKGGDASLGVSVATASVRGASLLSAHAEFRGYFEKALQVPGLIENDPVSAVKLTLALGSFTFYTRGTSGSAMETVRTLAETHGSRDDQEFILEGHWAHTVFDSCRYPEGLDLARQHIEHTSALADASRRFNSERVVGATLHFLGDQVGATSLLERVVTYAPPLTRRPVPVTIDTRISAGIALARALWLQGQVSRALRVGGEALARAKAQQQPIPICYVLAFALCPIAVWNRNRADARRLTQLLSDEATAAALGYWAQWGRFFTFATSNDGLEAAGELNPMQREMLGTLRSDLVDAELVAQCLADDRRWCAPELLRAAAQKEMSEGRDAPRVELLLLRALEGASRQNALTWELRTAMTLGRFWQTTAQRRRAVEILASVLARLPETTPDADAARGLLSELKGAAR